MPPLLRACGLALRRREALEEARTRRQGAQGQQPPAYAAPLPTGGPGEPTRPQPARPLGAFRCHDAMVYIRP